MPESRPRRLSLLTSQLGPVLALVLVFGLFAIADAMQAGGGRFTSLRNLQTMLVSSAPITIGALGMTVIIAAGGIDLSFGTAAALCATVMATLLRDGTPAPLAIAACILTGCVAGGLNGVLISGLRVPPFIVTLGSMTAYLGIAKIVADETTVRPPLASIPGWMSGLSRPTPDPSWLLLAPGVWFLLGIAIALSLVLRHTVFGRHVFALGSNEQTARLCGLHVTRLKIAVYGLGGMFVGLAGLYQFAKLNVGNPTSGLGLELKMIAAVVIGGASLTGGRGSVLGTLTGSLLMQTIATGCTQLGYENPVQDIILGVIIVAAVTVDRFRQRRAMD